MRKFHRLGYKNVYIAGAHLNACFAHVKTCYPAKSTAGGDIAGILTPATAPNATGGLKKSAMTFGIVSCARSGQEGPAWQAADKICMFPASDPHAFTGI
jgi:hypothetical protein